MFSPPPQIRPIPKINQTLEMEIENSQKGSWIFTLVKHNRFRINWLQSRAFLLKPKSQRSWGCWCSSVPYASCCRLFNTQKSIQCSTKRENKETGKKTERMGERECLKREKRERKEARKIEGRGKPSIRRGRMGEKVKGNWKKKIKQREGERGSVRRGKRHRERKRREERNRGKREISVPRGREGVKEKGDIGEPKNEGMKLWKYAVGVYF